MTLPQWFVMIGALLLFMGLTASLVKRSPLTSAIIYLAVGIVIGPTLLHLYHFNPLEQAGLLEMLTEGAVLISLFATGAKISVPFSFRRWRAPLLLATLAMSLTVGIITAFGIHALGLPLGAAVLLGAILAPTDPVLAGDIHLSFPEEHRRLRFALACEAGMNDGSAFPFVMLGLGLLGLHEVGDGFSLWLLKDVVWATAAGITLGVGAGYVLGMTGWKLRRAPYNHELMDDFVGLGLIAVVYGMTLIIGGYGFLAVFAAAVALRQTEIGLAAALPVLKPENTVVGVTLSEDAALAEPDPFADDEPAQTLSEGSLVFKEHLERLSIVLLILLLGGSLFLDSWRWDAVALALFVFFVARPLSVFACQIGSRLQWRARWLSGWFGVRGIGSLYYLMFAITHGLPEPLALQLTQLTLIVVTLSIVLHGISIKPLMTALR
jgi:NhaP-type Na+/H+ or K+/H+ antiporter